MFNQIYSFLFPKEVTREDIKNAKFSTTFIAYTALKALLGSREEVLKNIEDSGQSSPEEYAKTQSSISNLKSLFQTQDHLKLDDDSFLNYLECMDGDKFEGSRLKEVHNLCLSEAKETAATFSESIAEADFSFADILGAEQF